MSKQPLSTKLLRAIQARTARVAIGASTMRGAGGGGVVQAMRAYLQTLPLAEFGTGDTGAFRTSLDDATEALARALPKDCRHWGRARKGLNIFLRDCLYTVYLREAFRLQLAEEFFEIPLDSITGKNLHKSSNGALPRWTTVRGLTKQVSDKYQTEASRVASAEGIARVHLDAIWWGERSNAEEG